jgi:PAS domain-containing protein
MGVKLGLSLREEQRLRVFENRMLRRIFGPKREEVEGRWRRLHNEELHDMCASVNIIRVIKSRRTRWAVHVALMGQTKISYKILVGKPEVRRPLRGPRRRWED